MTPVEKLQEIALLRSKQVTSRVFLILLLLLAGVAVMWGFNISGLRAFNLIPFFLGFFYLLAVGASPVAIGASALTGSIIRAGNLSNPLAGIGDGVKFWLTVALPAAILSFCALAGFLATWPFENNPISFWYVAAFSVVLATAAILYKKGGEALYSIVVAYSVVIIGISLASSFFDFDTFSGSVRTVQTANQTAPIVAQKSPQPAIAPAAAPKISQAVMYPDVKECKNPPDYAVFCQEVTLYPKSEGGIPHQVRAPIGACLVEDGHELINRFPTTDPDGKAIENYYDYVPRLDRRINVMILAIPIGHSFKGSNVCGSAERSP